MHALAHGFEIMQHAWLLLGTLVAIMHVQELAAAAATAGCPFAKITPVAPGGRQQPLTNLPVLERQAQERSVGQLLSRGHSHGTRA